MNKRVLTILLSAVAVAGVTASSTFAASPAPCEDMLKDVRAAVSTAKLSDADKAKVTDLEAKGVERCNADDDKRADDFFAQALKIMGK
jgi:hypothetical protein